MPIYEYRCTHCGARMERLERMSSPPSKDCPECGADGRGKLERLFSAHAVGSSARSSAPPMPAACQGCPNPTSCGYPS